VFPSITGTVGLVDKKSTQQEKTSNNYTKILSFWNMWRKKIKMATG